MTCIAEIPSETDVCVERSISALTSLGVLGRQLGASLWEITLRSDQVSTGTVRIGERVIRLTAPLVGPQWLPERMWELLERNSLMGPGVRLGLAGGQRVVVIGETVLENVAEIESRIGRLVADMSTLNQSENEESTAPTVDPAALCEEAGWEFVRCDDAVVVRLEANRHGIGLQAAAIPFSAAIDVEGGIMRCVVELAGDDSPPREPNRSAVVALLMQAANQIRLVRPAPRIADNRNIVVFESRLLSSASAWELEQALSALSVAVRLCGPEVAALYRDANLAKEFLRIRFPSLVGPGIS